MDEIITFDKSLQQRLQEFNDVFSSSDILPASSLAKEWTFHLELTVDLIGWQAVWKIPRLTCESLHIQFPSVVLVFVLDVDFKDLKALVKIIAVQDDISIPESHWVPLIQLWPTKSQDKSIALNLLSTANALDMYRFFHFYIYMPWDRDEDDSIDWIGKHLESRLRLYYDMKNGTIPRVTAEYIHSRLTEARRLHSKRELLELQLKGKEGNEDLEFDRGHIESLMEIHVKLQEIRNEIEVVEDPLLRSVIIKQQTQLESKHSNGSQHIWVIFDEGTAGDIINFMEKVKNYYPTENLMVASNLALKLEMACSGDIFNLNESEHCIRTTGALENGGVLRGIGIATNIILTSKTEDVMMDFRDGNVLIENVTIDAKAAQCAILVRRGKGVLRNCKIVGDGVSSTHQGIIVLSGAELEIIDCDITGFFTSIVGNSGSKISLRNCYIHHVNVGMKIFDKCLVNVHNTSYHDCAEYGLVLEMEGTMDEAGKKVGNFETLKGIPYIESECVTGMNNKKGDFVISQKQVLKPVENLFSNPDLDPTVIEYPDKDECDLGKTIVEIE